MNLRIIEAVAERLNIAMDKFFVNIDKYGNTSSATIPIALDEATQSGRIKKGDIIILIAFGGAIIWSDFNEERIFAKRFRPSKGSTNE